VIQVTFELTLENCRHCNCAIG